MPAKGREFDRLAKALAAHDPHKALGEEPMPSQLMFGSCLA
jgi:hypothetical protein